MFKNLKDINNILMNSNYTNWSMAENQKILSQNIGFFRIEISNPDSFNFFSKSYIVMIDALTNY